MSSYVLFRVLIAFLVEQLPLARKERSSIASGALALFWLVQLV